MDSAIVDVGRFTEEVVEQLIEEYTSGKSSRQLASSLNAGQTTILRLLKDKCHIRHGNEAQPYYTIHPPSGRYQARKVWCLHNGVEKVPKGFHVHHIDQNPLNNNIENLLLLSVKDHMRLHRRLEKEARKNAKAGIL